jgi:hypothetical protein
LALAHKLRSAAQALLADAANQPAPLASALMQEAATIQGRADDLEKDAKPVEPTEFGSIVRAGLQGSDRELWQQTPLNGKHYWMSQSGVVEVWSELTDVEVLRVGLGEPADQDIYSRGVIEGQRYTCIQAHVKLQRLHDEAITSERKNALEKAIQAVEELAP